jgi:hypothetical protein
MKKSRKTKRKGTVAVKVIAPKFENGGKPGDRIRVYQSTEEAFPLNASYTPSPSITLSGQSNMDNIDYPLPKTYESSLRGFLYPNIVGDPSRTGYNPLTQTISYDPNSDIENINNPWWNEHEMFHHLQNISGGSSTAGLVGQRPNPYVASDESLRAYYDRRDADIERTIDAMIAQNPMLQFIPRNKLREGGPDFVGAEQLQYSDPTTLEGEARQYEQYIEAGNPSIFPEKEYANGGVSFDFDDTLSTDFGLQLAKNLPSNEKYIISARSKVTPDMIQRAEQAGIPKNRIFAMGSDEAKVAKVQELGINRHIDNKQSVIDRLGFKGQLFENGGITKLTSEEEKQFQNFYKSLPENLQTDDATYDIRGYWDSEGRPSAFDYSQPKEKDGYYHAYSINSNTGEYLKSPAHETFQHAVDEDRKIGYRPIPNVYGRNIATYNPSIIESTPNTFLTNTEGPIAYRYGGMYNPYQNLFANGGEQDEPPGRFFNWVKNIGKPKEQWGGYPLVYPNSIGSENSPRMMREVVITSKPTFWDKVKGAAREVGDWFENLNNPDKEWYEPADGTSNAIEQQDPNFWKWINKERDIKSKKATSSNKKQTSEEAPTSMSQGLFDMTFNNVDNMSSEELENIGRSMGPTLEGTKYLEMAAVQKQNEEIRRANSMQKAISEGSGLKTGAGGVPTNQFNIEYTPIATNPLPYSGLTGGPLITRQEQNARDFFNYLKDNKEVAQQVLGRELTEEELFNESGNYDNYAQSDLFLNSGNQEFINKVEEQKYQNFLAENEKASDEAGVIYNTLDFARSLVTDFPTTAYNLFQGKMPLYQQSRGLRGESAEYEDFYKKYADTGSGFINALNETQTLVNPLSNIQDATINYGQGNYGSAALNTLMALPVLGLFGKATGLGAKAIGLGENLGTKAINILGTEVLPNSKYLPGLTYGNVLEADMLYNTIKPEGYAQQAYEGFSEGDVSKGIENVVYGALGVLPFGIGAASGIAGATSKIAQSQAASAVKVLNQSAIDDVSRSLGLVDDAGNPISLNTISDETNFIGRLNTLKAYQEKGLIRPETNIDIVAESPDLYQTITKAAIKRATTVERSVNADAIASGVAESSRGTVTNLDAQDLAAIQELGLTAPEDIAFYAGTTIPYGKYGDVVGLQGIDRDLRGLYHYKQGQNKFGDVDLQYGPYTVQSRYPLDLETGTARTWLERYGELPIKEFKSGYGDSSLGYGDIFSQGTEAAVIGKSGETVLKPIKVNYASEYTANMNKIKGESSFTNTIYGSYKSGNTQAGETLVEMANLEGATNITNADEAHKFLSDLYFNRGLELQRNPGVKTKYFETFGEKAKFSPRTQKATTTENVSASVEEEMAKMSDIDVTNQMREEYKTISKTIEDIRADKVDRWQSAEGQKRLQEMIDNTPVLRDNGVTPQSYVEGIVNMTSTNKNYLEQLVSLDETNKAISQVDTLYDLGYITKEDWIAQTMNLEEDLVKKTDDLFKFRNKANLKGQFNAYMRGDRPLDIDETLKSAIKGYDKNKNAILDASKFTKKYSGPADKFTIGIGERTEFADLKQIIEHEIGHLLQKGEKTFLDNQLAELELKPNDLFYGLDESSVSFREKGWRGFKQAPEYFSSTKKYFESGSKGKEKLPFAIEVRQDLLDRGIIKDLYDPITPEMLQKHFNTYMSSGVSGNKTIPLRLYDIMTGTKKNFKILSNVMNKIPAVVPYVIGAGAAGAAGSQMTDDNKKMYGGTQRNKYIGLFR